MGESMYGEINIFLKKNKLPIDEQGNLWYNNRVRNENNIINLGVAQLVARYLGVVEAAGSSPVTQTKNRRFNRISDFLLFPGKSSRNLAFFVI